MERTLICELCGKEFKSKANNVKYCSAECKRLANIGHQVQRKRKVKSHGLDKVLKSLDEYNKKNGTNLSYGQFIAM